MAKYRFWTIIMLAATVYSGFFIWNSERADSERKFKLGLDLSGGTHLVYRADTSKIKPSDIGEAMISLRDTIERRINIFGVAEPLVQVEKGGVFGLEEDNRLIVELPGVTRIDEAVKRIGETPALEFKLLEKDNLPENFKDLGPNEISKYFIDTGLSGRQLKKAEIKFDTNSQNKPIIGLLFNDEGSQLFAKITKENVGQVLGIFLDGNLIEAPAIREEIKGGEAVITGNFTIDQAKKVVRDLNYGALPMPISLLSTEVIGATLGKSAIDKSIISGFVAFALVAIFLIAWYRLPGLIAVFGLAVYTALNLLAFKFIPVTLTAAGIAGFILSLGMAVDANILIFERMKEERKSGKDIEEAAHEGFKRAWNSIRDSNLSSIITAVILYYFASSPMIKGFALVFAIGVGISMFSAITASRTFLFALISNSKNKFNNFLFGSGIN